MRVKIHPFFGLLMLLSVTACIPPQIENRGHVDAMNRTKEIMEGTTTRDEVREMVGSPSVINNFGEEVWYYIRKQKEAVAFLEPEITDQHVTRIVFDEAGIVKMLEMRGLKDSQKVAIATETTATEGQQLGFFEQMLGNVGRFNASESARSAAPIRR